MNRTDRLYALVEELRAAAPRPRPARQLADRFEVSVRTIERDISALQQSGVPIWSATGPGGGYTIDPTMTLPPVNFTADEALAMAMALDRAGTMPFASAARTALQKLVAAMSDSEASTARALANRVGLIDRDQPATPLSPLFERAVLERMVLAVEYEDKTGVVSSREVEPAGFVGLDHNWYLLGWCRLREDGRWFRIDRIRSARSTGEVFADRSIDLVGDFPSFVRSVRLSE